MGHNSLCIFDCNLSGLPTLPTLSSLLFAYLLIVVEIVKGKVGKVVRFKGRKFQCNSSNCNCKLLTVSHHQTTYQVWVEQVLSVGGFKPDIRG